MNRLFSAAFVAGTIVAAAPAIAMTDDFNFRGTGIGIGDLNVKTATFSSVNSLLDVEVTAINTQEPPGAAVTRNGFGLGVRSGNELQGEIDNNFDNEALIFDFVVKSSITSITIDDAGPLDSWGLYGTNTDFTGLTSGGYGALSPATLVVSGNGSGIFNILSSGQWRYYVARLTTNNNDDFRVAAIHGVTPVPLPAGVALALSGLAVFFGLRRRMAAAA